MHGSDFHKRSVTREEKAWPIGVCDASQSLRKSTVLSSESRWEWTVKAVSPLRGIFPSALLWNEPKGHWVKNSPREWWTLGWLLTREASHQRTVEGKNPLVPHSPIPPGQEEMVFALDWQLSGVQFCSRRFLTCRLF